MLFYSCSNLNLLICNHKNTGNIDWCLFQKKQNLFSLKISKRNATNICLFNVTKVKRECFLHLSFVGSAGYRRQNCTNKNLLKYLMKRQLSLREITKSVFKITFKKSDFNTCVRIEISLIFLLRIDIKSSPLLESNMSSFLIFPRNLSETFLGLN